MDIEKRKQELSELEYKVTQEKATEPPFTGKLLHNKEKGSYVCKVCGHTLFSSEAKFDSDTGWPSFDRPENLEEVKIVPDGSHGMERLEVLCKNCGAHLGHLFPDGPTETGDRYCINSCSLDFRPKGD